MEDSVKGDSKGPIDAKKMAAIELLANGMSYREVGKSLGVVHQTIMNWNKDNRFNELVEQKKAEHYGLMVKSVDEQMNVLEKKAMDALEEMISESKSDSVRLRAIQLILNHQNSRKAGSEGQVVVSFGLPEPGMPQDESIEDGDTSKGDGE